MPTFWPLPAASSPRTTSCTSGSPDAVSHAGRGGRLAPIRHRPDRRRLGLRDLGGLESSLAQPRATFGGSDLHSSLSAKAAALGLSLTLNHPFIDGNKRTAHAAMEVFIVLNNAQLVATVDEQERLMLDLAGGRLTRADLTAWLDAHIESAPE